MCLPFGFLFQEFLSYLFYYLNMAFVCEFQHTPLCKMMFFSRFHISCGYEILFYFPTLSDMILQMVGNECVRFGGYVEVQVSYKILWLEVPKKARVLHNFPCFQEGLF
jgi:hypothetical protein